MLNKKHRFIHFQRTFVEAIKTNIFEMWNLAFNFMI